MNNIISMQRQVRLVSQDKARGVSVEERIKYIGEQLDKLIDCKKEV